MNTTDGQALHDKQSIRERLNISPYIFRKYFSVQLSKELGLTLNEFKKVNRNFNLNQSEQIENWLKSKNK